MSSTTICTTVWPVDQPSSCDVGLKARTLSVPTGRCWAKSRCARAIVASSRAGPRQEVLGRDEAVVGGEERLQLPAGPAPPAASLGPVLRRGGTAAAAAVQDVGPRLFE